MKKIKKMKIKKESKNKKTSANDLFDMVEDNEKEINKQRADKTKATKEKNKKTSTSVKFYRKNKLVGNWTAIDFFGWYLYNYEKYFDEEDITYAGKTNSKQFGSELSRMKYVLTNTFGGDKEEFKKFIRFGVKWAASPGSWYSAFGFWNLFNKSLAIVKLYNQHKKGKFQLKRFNQDNDWGSAETWEKFFGGDKE